MRQNSVELCVLMVPWLLPNSARAHTHDAYHIVRWIVCSDKDYKYAGQAVIAGRNAIISACNGMGGTLLWKWAKPYSCRVTDENGNTKRKWGAVADGECEFLVGPHNHDEYDNVGDPAYADAGT